MLHNYVDALDGDACDIIGNDAEFSKAVQLYKNVVIHYLVAKMEIWTALVMAPIHGVDGGY